MESPNVFSVNDGIGRNRSDTSGFVAPLGFERERELCASRVRRGGITP